MKLNQTYRIPSEQNTYIEEANGDLTVLLKADIN